MNSANGKRKEEREEMSIGHRKKRMKIGTGTLVSGLSDEDLFRAKSWDWDSRELERITHYISGEESVSPSFWGSLGGLCLGSSGEEGPPIGAFAGFTFAPDRKSVV